MLPLLVLVPLPAAAQYREHRELGLLLGAGGGYTAGTVGPLTERQAKLALVELGASWTIDYDRNDLLGRVRVEHLRGGNDVSLLLDYRPYFDLETWRTFFDLGVVAHVTSPLTLGAHAGVGADFVLTSSLRFYATLGMQLGSGQAFRFSADLSAGIRWSWP